MIDKTFAENFAQDWVEAWNQHNLERILAHYSEDFEISSPMIIKVMAEPAGTLKGKESVRAYWEKALQLLPNLHFELIETLIGTHSIVLYYQGVSGKAAEVFHFNASGLVFKTYAHYF